MRPATILAVAAALVVAAVLVSSPTAPQTRALHILPCPDLNGDGLVTSTDFLFIATTYVGQSVPPAPQPARRPTVAASAKANTAVLLTLRWVVIFICSYVCGDRPAALPLRRAQRRSYWNAAGVQPDPANRKQSDNAPAAPEALTSGPGNGL